MEKNKNIWIGIAVVILVSTNLRAPITAVSPILDEMKSVLKIDNFQASLLTSIPLFVFAFCSILVSKATAKINIRHGLIYSLIILTIGIYVRIYGNISMLYIGSLLIGLGICIGNVLTPAYIKNTFPTKIGIMTGIFSVSMSLIAALASGLSIAIGNWTNLGWKGSLGVWIIAAIAALIIVCIDSLKNKTATQQKTVQSEDVKFNIFKSKQAWNISIFMGLQSLIYYCLVALLPTLLIDFGMTKTNAGWVFSVLQLAMLPAMLVSPILASRMKNPKIMIYITSALYFIGIITLLIFKAKFSYLSAILIGIAGGFAFSLSILFFSLKTKTMVGTIKISGMAQSVGYLIAAFGPPIFGKLYDIESTWSYSLYFLMFCMIILTFFGIKASQPKFVEED
ncbi:MULTISPECIES: CynX/NimT family MFS transporter [Empedobacter]|uniref:MFS transporter n=1 Tax=Empedobacter falsenii TaxID=343874 RepID=A0A7H9DQJ3_9FLAO|nr:MULTISPECIES: MFS transporter [Empedobacter]MDH2207588.1 MFS transporter [Empedobacter sp. GD03644]QLL57275.1 MFS transporter [Empedobacter falsenii]